MYIKPIFYGTRQAVGSYRGVMNIRLVLVLILLSAFNACRVEIGLPDSARPKEEKGVSQGNFDPAPVLSTNLIADPGFDAGVSGFGAGETAVTVERVSRAETGNTLQIGLHGYGNSAWWSRELHGKATLFTARASVISELQSTSMFKFCAFITYTDDTVDSECARVSGSAGSKGQIEVELAPRDKIIILVRIRVELEGSDSIILTLDDAFAGFKDYVPVARPGSGGGGNNGGPGNGSDPNDIPPPAGTPYPGYVYTTPSERPYINLDAFQASGINSQAFNRLKSEVDGATAFIAAQPANMAYDTFVEQMNHDFYGYSCTDSVVMFKLTGHVPYIHQAIKMMDIFVRAEQEEINAGRRPRVSWDSYLEVGYYLEQLALVYDYGYGYLTGDQRVAWQNFAETTLNNLWYPAAASWGGVAYPWSGWSINDPGNNYFYSFLKATQLWAWASQNTLWIRFLQQRKYPLLVPFFSNLTGGGTREGTGYGTAIGSMFENYRYWRSSTGEDLSALSTHSRDTIDYWIHATVPTLDYYAPIGDQARSADPRMFDFQRRLMLEAVSLNMGSPQAAKGIWWLNRARLTDGGNGSEIGRMHYNYDYRFDLLAPSGGETQPTALVYDASGVGVLFARSDWTTGASWFATVAGIYDQSHAHAEQGGFTFYKNGWLAVTSNIHSHNGINQEVDVHNVVRFVQNGVSIQQRYATTQRNHNDSGTILTVHEDLSNAYNPQYIQQWLRTYRYDRTQHTLDISDACMVSNGVAAVFQIHTPELPAIQPNGNVIAGGLILTPVVPVNPNIYIVDMRTLGSQYQSGYRIDIPTAETCSFQVKLKPR